MKSNPKPSLSETSTTTAPMAHKPKLKGKRDLPRVGPSINLTYRIWYRDCFDMEKTFTKDHAYYGPIEEILTQVNYEMGHYGGIKAEAIAGDLHEITN